MINLKVADKALLQAVKQLKEANKQLAFAKKDADNAKTIIQSRIKELRDIDIATLKIGDSVHVEKMVLVEIGSQFRFDVAAFQIANPELHAKYVKDFTTIKYKALI